MWLDRLAAQAGSSGSSTPQPASRPYSPAPRRTSSTLSPYVNSHRPGNSPRGSSLSLISNDSNNSLLPSSRKPNGSGLKQSSIVDQGTEPLEILEKLLSIGTDRGEPIEKKGSSVSVKDLELEFEFQGLSLKDLAAHGEHKENKQITRRSQTTQEYEKEWAKFEDLHKSIAACDDVLNSVETNLATFRNDLATVSADIEALQERSTILNRRLENRQAVEKALAPLIEELSVPPEAILKISDGPIDEAWVKMLAEVDRRDATHKKRASGDSPSKASQDLGPLLEKLILKAIERIRDYLVAQIKALRSPNINAQIIQQTKFLRFKDLYTFLHKHHSQLADEIALAYMNTMRWYYVNQFSRYEKALGKVKLHAIDRNDAIGHEDTARKVTVLSSARVAGSSHDAFSLGRRLDITKTKSQIALSSYLAEEDQSTHYLEVPFRNFNLALIDNATFEYGFLAAFFSPALSYSQISKNFNYIFEPTFELGQTLSKTLAGETYDVLGLLICIRLNQHFAFQLQRRRVPALDGYINGTNMLLWPRVQVIMDRHCESVKAATAALPAKLSKAEAAKSSIAPHLITQRFGQLLQGFLSLSAEAGDDEPMVGSMGRLRSEVEAFLAKMSHNLADERKSQRFLYNNYSLILTIIGDVGGKLANDQMEFFEQLKRKYQEQS